MSIGSFLKLVEIQTKVASVIPYLLGTLFALYAFDDFKITEAVLLFAGMLVFDMTTTAINNYIDHTKAIKKEGFGYEEHNAIGRDGLDAKMVLKVIIGMLVLSTALGIALVLTTDLMVLVVGVICFAIGIFYSFGPIPISRTPFGEVFSGVTMGFLITFLAVYVHIYDKGIIGLSLTKETLALTFNIEVIISIFIVSMPAIAGIANIMLANNICDMEDDLINRRYTLPIYIGKAAALQVFKWTYYIGFVGIVIGVVLRMLPVVALGTLIALKPVGDHIKAFFALQSKAETFVLAVKNFVMMNVLYILTLIIGCLMGVLVK
ncbi:MAG: 1,4-dihydroxy-2-naphthoate polyprenyltransferase [Cellulosilyticaceae bacterium]